MIHQNSCLSSGVFGPQRHGIVDILKYGIYWNRGSRRPLKYDCSEHFVPAANCKCSVSLPLPSPFLPAVWSCRVSVCLAASKHPALGLFGSYSWNSFQIQFDFSSELNFTSFTHLSFNTVTWEFGESSRQFEKRKNWGFDARNLRCWSST